MYFYKLDGDTVYKYQINLEKNYDEFNRLKQEILDNHSVRKTIFRDGHISFDRRDGYANFDLKSRAHASNEHCFIGTQSYTEIKEEKRRDPTSLTIHYDTFRIPHTTYYHIDFYQYDVYYYPEIVDLMQDLSNKQDIETIEKIQGLEEKYAKEEKYLDEWYNRKTASLLEQAGTRSCVEIGWNEVEWVKSQFANYQCKKEILAVDLAGCKYIQKVLDTIEYEEVERIPYENFCNFIEFTCGISVPKDRTQENFDEMLKLAKGAISQMESVDKDATCKGKVLFKINDNGKK